MGFMVKLLGRSRPALGERSREEIIAELLAKLTPDIREDRDTEWGSESYEAADQLAAMGQPAAGPLMRTLAISSRAHYALGQIAGEGPLQALCRELESGQWRRIEAAARALGKRGDERALEPLRRHTGTQSAEVYRAVSEAIALIEQTHMDTGKLFAVDRENPVGQVDRFWSLQRDIRQNSEKRQRLIRWHAQFVEAMPELRFDSDETRGRIWGMLGTMIYYAINPNDTGFHHPCPEAANCYEQCLKYTPERLVDIGNYLRSVRRSPGRA